MTTSKTNAMIFIERLYEMSLANHFRFNMKKLRTNFFINVAKIGWVKENAKALARAAALAARGEKDEKGTSVVKMDKSALSEQ